MADLIQTPELRAARNAASIALADAGAGVSSIQLYTTSGGLLLGARRLKRPCGVLDNARIRLEISEEADLAVATGSVSWAAWCDGGGDPIAAGHVTDLNGNYTTPTGAVEPHPAGPGVWRINSTDGAPGTTVYAGGTINIIAALIG